MGGRVAVHVADARPAVVSLLILAEASIDPDDRDAFADQPEDDYLERVLPELLEAQSQEAEANPAGLRAAHVEMTRLIEPRAIYRERVSMDHGVSVRPHLSRLKMPKWYLNGALSGDDEGLEADLAGLDIGWKVVPATGHPMGLQNPAGFAQTIAEVLAISWSG
jgi:pimeloyl-ACP methyl ester carboxylesterase